MTSDGEITFAIVREFFPDATDDQVNYIVWNDTGWPCFWENEDWQACMRRQVSELKSSLSSASEPPR